MKTIFRYLAIGLFAAIVFLVVTVAIFIAVFDANAYKQDLSNLVREQTGRELQFHGDVDLTLYPALGMKLGAMSLSNAPGFGALPMIKVKQASVSVDVASLIGLSPQIDKLVMRDLEINLITNKAGVTNWDDLIVPSAPQADAGEVSAEPKAAEDDSDFKIEGAFAGLDLENVKLLWLDEQAGNRRQQFLPCLVANDSNTVNVMIELPDETDMFHQCRKVLPTLEFASINENAAYFAVFR